MFLRKDVWANGGDFDDETLLWYAKGVGVLKNRPLDDKTSWRFLAAIHGINSDLWQQYGYYTPGEPIPSNDDQQLYWNQCQHQSWYFLPWHRGYVLSLESIVRQAIIDLGGPDDWAIPYWDYSNPSNTNSRQLPPAFSKETLPDGSPNPLFVVQRYGAQFDTLPLPVQDVALQCLNNTEFTGTSPGGSPGFGGPQTIFSHGGGISGALESVPHNIVHVDVGQQLSGAPGLMSDPETAGLDPIFFLHHANIDRLWSFWLTLGNGRANPTSTAWLNGPVERSFIVPTVEGTGMRYAPRDMLNTENLNYQYDPLGNNDIPLPPSNVLVRSKRLGFAMPNAPLLAMSENRKPSAELIGANEQQIKISKTTKSKVTMDNRMMSRSAMSFTENAISSSIRHEPDRYYLNLENIRANCEGLSVDVHLHVKGKDILIGSLGLFGVKSASRTELSHGGAGMTVTLDVTDHLDDLHLSDGIQSLTDLDISISPRMPVENDIDLTVERISLYREF